MNRCAATTVALLAILALGARSARAQAPNPQRERARYVLEVHCGMCHREDSPRVQQKALAVYNLNEIDWAARMSAAQLGAARDRLDGLGEASEADRKVFAEFVASELARRARPPR